MSMRLMTKAQYRHVRNYNYPATEQPTIERIKKQGQQLARLCLDHMALKSWKRHTSLASGCRSWRRADLVLDLGDQAGYCGDGSIPHVPLATTSRKDSGGSMDGGGAGCDGADNDAQTMSAQRRWSVASALGSARVSSAGKAARGRASGEHFPV